MLINILGLLNQWDQTVFQWINSGLSNQLFDNLLPWFREKWTWAPLYLFLLAFSILNFKKKAWVIIIGLALSAGMADYTSSVLIKKNVQRIRPCNDVEMAERVVERVPCGSGYSFTSSHAANHFAVAMFLVGAFGFLGPWVKYSAFTWAALIAISQVYVGVHYPGDVTFGALLGCLIGRVVFWLLNRRYPLSADF